MRFGVASGYLIKAGISSDPNFINAQTNTTNNNNKTIAAFVPLAVTAAATTMLAFS
jgi:hypothetical protein